MPWWQIFKRDDDEHEDSGQAAERPQERQTSTAQMDPAIRNRRRQRLQQRINNLRYDIAQAESALEEQNRWNERVQELDQAISQARDDIKQIMEAPGGEPDITLPETPVEIVSIQGEAPSDVQFEIGGERFRYSEEIDWDERGHQRSEVMLRRFGGTVSNLIPDETPADRREALHEHLAHSLASLAVMLRDNALEGKPQPELTLSDLAKPCPECGGWRDHLDRCLACQRRIWQADEIHAEIDRLLDERDSQLNELARWRDALPVLRRQLESAQQEIEKYRT
ncbi:MAG: hypothetical protein ACOC9Y_02580 [Chloroflexota bacterium]